MRLTLSPPPYFPDLRLLVASALLWGLALTGKFEWSFWASALVSSIIALGFWVEDFRSLGWEGGSFVAKRLFRPTLFFTLGEINDIKIDFNGVGGARSSKILILRKGDVIYTQVTGGLWPGIKLDGILELPGVRAAFSNHLHSGGSFQIGSRELRLEGNNLFVRDKFHPEVGGSIGSMRITKSILDELFLHYSSSNSMDLGSKWRRSIWQLLLLELPFPRQ